MQDDIWRNENYVQGTVTDSEQVCAYFTEDEKGH